MRQILALPCWIYMWLVVSRQRIVTMREKLLGIDFNLARRCLKSPHAALLVDVGIFAEPLRHIEAHTPPGRSLSCSRETPVGSNTHLKAVSTSPFQNLSPSPKRVARSKIICMSGRDS